MYLLQNNIKKIGSRNFSILCNKYGLNKIGINNPDIINYNLSKDELFKHENENKEGKIFISQSEDMMHLLHKNKYNFFSENLVFGVDTGKFTGRSPKDKWIVKNLGSESDKNLGK